MSMWRQALTFSFTLQFPPFFKKNGTFLSLVTFFNACSHVTCNWVRALVPYDTSGCAGELLSAAGNCQFRYSWPSCNTALRSSLQDVL